jgi:polar amino acid transport system substrate-binding protein
MSRLVASLAGSARSIGLASLLASVPLACSAAPLAARPGAGPPADAHQVALAALADLQVAIDAIVAAEDSYSTDPAFYRAAAQRAIEALAGTQDGAPGGVRRIEELLATATSQPWVAPLRSADVNMSAAVARLQSAKNARELNEFQIEASQALIGLEVAKGRPTELGVFGGLEGALATTALGVPTNARQVDGCAAPLKAPAWGTRDGYLAFVALPAGSDAMELPRNMAETDVSVRNGVILMHTPAAGAVAKLCGVAETTSDPGAGSASPAGTSQPSDARSGASSPHRPPPASAPPASAPDEAAASTQPTSAQAPRPALYTEAQAQAGKQVYEKYCVACHGANLHGTAAPSVAGTDFLSTAKNNEWTLEVIRYLVFTMMPLNAGGQLTPEQYANVMAFLLASNCFPAGSTPFPQTDDPSFANIKLGPSSEHHPGENALGVCPVP